MKPIKIISGGQTGADRGGLNTAIYLGLPHGGWCPRGRRAEDGAIPEVYQLQETLESRDYLRRTELNVKDSDVTVIFVGKYPVDGGSKKTEDLCELHKKPCITINLKAGDPQDLADFLRDYNPSVINVAGNRESKAPGIEENVMHFLLEAFSLIYTDWSGTKQEPEKKN